ncbi:MAG: DUF3623 domain-containing protein [Comamonadaceae bacterium]|nr:MAG: DUF3623 domain-containing protein [Comamonadaceae bacterium]
MSLYLLPVCYTLFVWWFSTGVILYLTGLPRPTYRWTLGAATLLLLLALAGLHLTRNDASVGGAYLAFSCALLVWAWQEIAFLLGTVTGPRRTPCPAGASGWRRAHLALQTLLHHELALLALGAAVLLCVRDGSNPTGLWTFAVLWTMRQSAKLNVFLGVRNLSENFLPAHLKYLQTYFRRAPMNPLFPVTVASAIWVATLLWQGATADATGAFSATCLTFAATLLSLAVLEHGFMVLPLPSEALWAWGLRSRVANRVEVRRSTRL